MKLHRSMIPPSVELDAIVFWLVTDEGREVQCKVTRRAVEDRVETGREDIHGLLAGFQRHRDRIEMAAAQKFNTGLAGENGSLIVELGDLHWNKWEKL